MLGLNGGGRSLGGLGHCQFLFEVGKICALENLLAVILARYSGL
jgi:hypothetical protein